MQCLLTIAHTVTGIFRWAEGGKPGEKKDVQRRTSTSRKISQAAFRKLVVCLPAIVMMAPLSGCGSTQNPKSPASETPKTIDAAPKDFVNYTETIKAEDGTVITFEMIAVPGGSLRMGSPDSEQGRKKDEGPQHEVTVGPFWIGKTEVTWDEYEAFGYPYRPKGSPWMEEYVDGVTRPTLPWGDAYRGFGRDGKPVVGVSWYGAMVYCRWLSRRTGKMFRLPTEAEWEYACRAGSEGKFCFGDDESKLSEYAWCKGYSKHETHRVATKKPNAWGIYDMHGNVSEWCLDWYKPDYYASMLSGKWPNDPQGTGEGHQPRFPRRPLREPPLSRPMRQPRSFLRLVA